jgi:hypothetical protein
VVLPYTESSMLPQRVVCACATDGAATAATTATTSADLKAGIFIATPDYWDLKADRRDPNPVDRVK